MAVVEAAARRSRLLQGVGTRSATFPDCWISCCFLAISGSLEQVFQRLPWIGILQLGRFDESWERAALLLLSTGAGVVMTGVAGVSAMAKYYRLVSTAVRIVDCRSTARSIPNAVPLRDCEPGSCGRGVSKYWRRAGRCEPSQRSASTQSHCPDTRGNPLKLAHLPDGASRGVSRTRGRAQRSRETRILESIPVAVIQTHQARRIRNNHSAYGIIIRSN